MDDIKNNNFGEEDNFDDGNINIIDIVHQYLKHWKWFLLSIIICTIFVFYKLNFITPQYRTESTIKIKDEKTLLLIFFIILFSSNDSLLLRSGI